MHVDGAGENVQAARIEGIARERHRLVGADCDDAAVLDRDAGGDRAVMRHHRAVADDEVGGGGHCGPAHSIAQPPSTGRSTPVIWREASLARNRQALATSASIVTRLSA